MNIFILHLIPYLCAKYHCDTHCIKMILETGLILSTSHRVLDGIEVKLGNKKYYKLYDDTMDSTLYKNTHMKHPCTLWAMESRENYEWLYKLFCCLCDEYTHRYEKVHATDTKLRNILSTPPKNIKSKGFTKPALAMPDEYKVDNDVVSSYRIYYIYGKNKIARWQKTSQPWWWLEEV